MSGRKLPPPTIDHLYSVKVDNISYHTSPNDLRRLFDRYGEIGDVHIPRDRRTRQSRGFGFVRFFSRKDAEYAISRVDGKRIDGRELRCSMAKYDRPIDEKHRSRSRSPPPRRRSRSRSPRSRSRSPIRERSPSRSRSR
uniref:Serine/arginine-rich splicing factor 2 n=1 Tax=Acrobeloides nanus TaxID=290746 RepID=A0A914DYL8_9BILA